jgi:hypothetical protein
LFIHIIKTRICKGLSCGVVKKSRELSKMSQLNRFGIVATTDHRQSHKRVFLSNKQVFQLCIIKAWCLLPLTMVAPAQKPRCPAALMPCLLQLTNRMALALCSEATENWFTLVISRIVGQRPCCVG